jgi:hypothetical protein
MVFAMMVPSSFFYSLLRGFGNDGSIFKRSLHPCHWRSDDACRVDCTFDITVEDEEESLIVFFVNHLF